MYEEEDGIKEEKKARYSSDYSRVFNPGAQLSPEKLTTPDRQSQKYHVGPERQVER